MTRRRDSLTAIPTAAPLSGPGENPCQPLTFPRRTGFSLTTWRASWAQTQPVSFTRFPGTPFLLWPKDHGSQPGGDPAPEDPCSGSRHFQQP